MINQIQQKFEDRIKSRTRTGNNKYKKYKDILGEYGYYRLRKIYSSMKQRCYDKNCTRYLKYGDRGITICKEWPKDKTLFYDWCISNGYNNDLSIDRIDNDKGYSPENCRWVNEVVQSNNRRNIQRHKINGEWLTLTEICRKYDIKECTMWNRFYRDGCSIEEIIRKKSERKINKNAIRYTYQGEELTIKELTKINNIKQSTLYHRLKKGEPIEIAILTKENYTLACRKAKEIFLGENK